MVYVDLYSGGCCSGFAVAGEAADNNLLQVTELDGIAGQISQAIRTEKD
jgi:hypothetical protein